ncbi:MAG: carotenoid biosynthesis protein [Bdellovibrio sp.]|nr:carotenoid biosynthesis protein [Bdellovibrio sp.]
MVLLVLINSISIFGYATFVLNPQLLNQFSWAPAIFVVSFPLFAQAQILVGFLVMAVECHRGLNKSWYFYFAAAFLISFVMEYAGTTYGIPFGKYSYTSFLGWKIAGQVPVLIPLSWFFMALPSYLIAEQILGQHRWPFAKTLLGSVLLVSWDLTLDPAMSHLTSYWIWEETANSILKIPIKNIFGWIFTGILILGSFELKGLKMPEKWKQDQFPLKFYAANLMLPVGFSIAAGLWFPVVATILVLFFCIWVSKQTGGFRNFWKSEPE